MIQITINPVGFIITALAGVVYYLIFEAAGAWLLGSVIGTHVLIVYLSKKIAMMHAAHTIGTLAGECQNLALHIQKLAKENKELSRKLGVKEIP